MKAPAARCCPARTVWGFSGTVARWDWRGGALLFINNIFLRKLAAEECRQDPQESQQDHPEKIVSARSKPPIDHAWPEAEYVVVADRRWSHPLALIEAMDKFKAVS